MTVVATLPDKDGMTFFTALIVEALPGQVREFGCDVVMGYQFLR